MSTTIQTLIEDLIAREGDYADHPADKGGPTRWGVTEAVARANGYAGSMRRFPRDEASSIYKRLYWERPGFARLERSIPRVAAELFDTGVNMGPATAAGFLRRTLNALNRNGRDFGDVAEKGFVDHAVEAAVAAFIAVRGRAGEAVLLKALEALQGERYLSLAEKRPANEAFLYGWLANRLV
jgi:lysozyme family protein